MQLHSCRSALVRIASAVKSAATCAAALMPAASPPPPPGGALSALTQHRTSSTSRVSVCSSSSSPLARPTHRASRSSTQEKPTTETGSEVEASGSSGARHCSYNAGGPARMVGHARGRGGGGQGYPACRRWGRQYSNGALITCPLLQITTQTHSSAHLAAVGRETEHDPAVRNSKKQAISCVGAETHYFVARAIQRQPVQLLVCDHQISHPALALLAHCL